MARSRKGSKRKEWREKANQKRTPLQMVADNG
jgi:hypothetical protein